VAKQRIHVMLHAEDLAHLDASAERLGVTRLRLIASIIEDWVEREQEAAWVAEHAEEALAEPGVPWEEVEAELGL